MDFNLGLALLFFAGLIAGVAPFSVDEVLFRLLVLTCMTVGGLGFIISLYFVQSPIGSAGVLTVFSVQAAAFSTGTLPALAVGKLRPMVRLNPPT